MKKIVSPILALRAKKGKEIITKKIERKQMNILIDELPDKVEIEGEEIEINTDFRNVLLYFRLLKDEELEAIEKVEIAMRLFFKRVPKDVGKAIRYINEEYIVSSGMKQIRKLEQRGLEKEKAAFDFEQDGGLIFASFWQQYKINLIETKMHWRVFKALFDGLGEETVLRRVMEFRRMKPKDMPRERRLELLELQRELSIKDTSVRDTSVKDARVKDPSSKSQSFAPSEESFSYNDNGSSDYRRSAKEIEKELIEGLNNG
jgi:hypothetical protein